MWSSSQIWLVSFCSCLLQCSLIILSIAYPILYKKFRYKPVTCRGLDLILYVVSETFFDDDDCVAVVVLTYLALEGLWQFVCCQLGIVAFDVCMSEVVIHWSRVRSLTVLKFSFCSYLKWMHNEEHEYIWVISWTFTRAFSIVIIFQTNTLFWKLPAAKMYCLFWILWHWKNPCEYWWYYSSKTIVKNSYFTVRCLSYHMCYQL
jgi:hypothetical protein